MDRGDLRTVEQGELAAQTAVSGRLRSFCVSASAIFAFISAAAAFVKVTIKNSSILQGSASSRMRRMTRSTSTAVLPDPAAAETSSARRRGA